MVAALVERFVPARLGALYRRLEARWPLANIMKVCLTLEVFMHLSLAVDDEPGSR
jgi:hypothetical protein